MTLTHTPALPPAATSALANHISGPVATTAAIIVGGLVLIILVFWLAKKVLHKVIGTAIGVGVALGTHAGTQQWIHHLVLASVHT